MADDSNQNAWYVKLLQHISTSNGFMIILVESKYVTSILF